MNGKFLLLALLGVSSCGTAYKLGQTPDDVYFSPAPPQNGYVQVSNDEDKTVYDNSSSDDREIRSRVNRRILRKSRVDYGYDYPYGYNYPYGYYPPVYVDPKTGTSAPVYKAPRKSNPGTYTAPVTVDPKTGKLIPVTGNTSVRTLSTPPASGSRVGNFIRKVLSSSNTNSVNINDNNTQTRTFESPRSTNSSSSSGSSQSSRSGGNAPVRSFNK